MREAWVAAKNFARKNLIYFTQSYPLHCFPISSTFSLRISNLKICTACSGATVWTDKFVPSFLKIAKCSYVCNKIFNELFYRRSYAFENWRMSLRAYPRKIPILEEHIRSWDVRASKNTWWIVTVANRKIFKSDYDWIYSRIPTKRTFFSWVEKKATF